MKILVISGSPKGEHSITFQSIRYVQKHHPDVEFEVFHVGKRIKAIERDPERLDEIIDSVRDSDCVLWCYPVYTFLVPYQLVKFIDLIFERKQGGAFQHKYASQLSTSKHFYDHTAYNHVHRISQDLGMKHLHGHCADMDDLTTEPGRERLLTFAEELLGAVESEAPVSVVYPPAAQHTRTYLLPQDLPQAPKSDQHNVVLVTDCTDPDSNLGRMIDVYQRALPNRLHVLNIGELDFQGGCRGCFECAFDAKCVYKDGFDDLHRSTVLSADCVIIAASIRHHWFNPVWKCYDDRQFYNGHRTSMMGKSTGYIISGALRQEPNLRQILEARSEVGQLYLLDIVTDEYDTDAEITALLIRLAEKTMSALETQPSRPSNFLGVGGMKVFRDLIYIMSGLMQEDHRFYKRHGLYDFPQKQVKMTLKMKLVGLLLRSPKMRKRASRRMHEVILQPYRAAIERH